MRFSLPVLLTKVFAIICFLFYNHPALAQMHQIYIDTPDNEVRKISFISASEGYVGFKDWIGYTSDSGHTFIKKYISQGNVNLNGYYINGLDGFAIGGVSTIDKSTIIVYGGYGLVPAILRSTDGGNSFKLVYYSQFNNQELRTAVLDMIFPGNNGVGYAVDADRILKTTDGGNSWYVARTDPASYFDHLEAVDNNTVIAMSTQYETNKILLTSNGGASWKAVNLPVVHNGKFAYAFFLSALKGYINMYDDDHHYYYFKTFDAGNSWTLLNNPEATVLQASKMKFVNDSIGYVMGYSTVYKTVNGGAIWEPLSTDRQMRLNDLQVISADQLLAGGEQGFLEMSINGGGRPYPLAAFVIDTSGVSVSGKVNLINNSRKDYSYSWFKNSVLISSSYSDSYDHNPDEYADTIKLVVSNGYTSDTLIKYQYYQRPVPPEPSIVSFTPTFGQKGSIITITGNNFIGVSAVSFGGVPAISYNVLSPTTISAVLDSGRSGEIKVITAYGVATIQKFASVTPILNSFSPKSGGPGTIITITGESLMEGNLTPILRFGGTITSFVYSSKTTLVATVGKGSSGDITFETQYGTATISGFTYIAPPPPPSISSFAPLQADKGSIVTITGNNFIGATAVLFGVTPAFSFTVISPTTISAIVGQGSSGKVYVTTPTGTDSLTGFEYTTPTITTFTPTIGGRGTIVQITGANFTGVTSVNFGGVNASSYTVNSPTNITATVPAGASGNVVIVSPHGSVASPGFIFNSAPNVNRISPDSGPVGSTIKIYGSNFSMVASDNIVYFGPVRGAVTAATSNILTVIVPAGATYAPVMVSTHGLHSFSSSAFLVTYPERQLTDETYATVFNLDAASRPAKNIISDLDGDGKPDMIVKSDSTISLFKNKSIKGSIQFEKRVDMSVPDILILRTADIDGDGKPDLVITKNNHLFLLKNTSNTAGISFGSMIDLGITFAAKDMVIADMNGDGKQDLVMINANFTCVALNTSNTNSISFSAPVNVVSSYFHMPNSVAVVDFDGDGKPDIAVSNTYSTGYSDIQNSAISIYRNTLHNDTLSFAPEINFGVPGTYTDISSADLNGDGKPEIVFGIVGYYTKSNNTFLEQHQIMVLKNTSVPGSITFSNSFYNSGGTGVAAIGFGNMDGDAKPDIAIANSYAPMAVLKNTNSIGAVSFTPPSTYFPVNDGRKSNITFDISVVDMDNDSKPEIISCNTLYNQVIIFKNSDSVVVKTVCADGNIQLTGNITGSNYQWKVNSGAGFVNITDNSHYVGTATKTLQLNNIPSAWNSYQYKCVSGNISGNIFTLAVDSILRPKVTIVATDTIICAGRAVTFNSVLKDEGDKPTFQWFVNGTNAGENIPSFTTSSLTNNSGVKLMLTSSAACVSAGTVNSNTIKISVKDTVTSSVSIAASTTNICAGENVSFTSIPVNGGSGPSYEWLVNETNIGNTSNSFASNTLRDNDKIKVVLTSNAACVTNPPSSSNTIEINVDEPVIPAISLNNNSIVIINPDSTAHYTWQLLNDSTWSDVATAGSSFIYNPTLKGNYRVKSTKGQCTSYSALQSIEVILRESDRNNFAILYPNPANGFITFDSLKLSDNWETLTISNLQGVIILPAITIKNKTKVTVDVSDLPTGAYFATFRRKNGKLVSATFVKQ